MSKSEQTIMVGTLEFVGKTMRGGWVRWYPVNAEAFAFLASRNRRLHQSKHQQYLRDDSMKELCFITGQEFKSREQKVEINKLAQFAKLKMWVEDMRCNRQVKPEEIARDTISLKD